MSATEAVAAKLLGKSCQDCRYFQLSMRPREENKDGGFRVTASCLIKSFKAKSVAEGTTNSIRETLHKLSPSTFQICKEFLCP